MDIGRVKIRLENIRKNATDSVSFAPSDAQVRMQEFFQNPKMQCLENPASDYSLNPRDISLIDEWNIFAYDESAQNYKSLEGDLYFCSSSVVKIEERYAFNLTALPHFLTSIGKFQKGYGAEIKFTENIAETRNRILVDAKTESVKESTEPNSIVLIDGPIIGGMASSKLIKMDTELRRKNCIPIYFVKNSNSRLVIDNDTKLQREFNSDFHWATRRVKEGSRSPFFMYTDQYSPEKSKVFTYFKPLLGFPERVEMYSATYERYHSLIPSLMNLVAYFFIVQGDYSNPQVRPIVIAEKFAREGLRILNIPVLLRRLGFHPTINQVRFG